MTDPKTTTADLSVFELQGNAYEICASPLCGCPVPTCDGTTELPPCTCDGTGIVLLGKVG